MQVLSLKCLHIIIKIVVVFQNNKIWDNFDRVSKTDIAVEDLVFKSKY